MSTFSFLSSPLQVAINGERPWVDPDCPEPLRRLITKCWHQVTGRSGSARHA